MDCSEVTTNVNRHPWELSRSDSMLWLLHQYGIKGNVLDYGCGDGYFSKILIKREPGIESIWGVDSYLDEISHDDCIHLVDSIDKVECASFDFILLMDVLEHIEDDIGLLRSLHTYLKADGFILVSVPAFQRLFSLHDLELHHFRRYNRKQLQAVVEKCGFVCLRWSYFYTCLIFLRILTWNKTQNIGIWNKDVNRLETKVIRTLLNFDFRLCLLLSDIGLRIGGLSLFALIKRNGQEGEFM